MPTEQLSKAMTELLPEWVKTTLRVYKVTIEPLSRYSSEFPAPARGDGTIAARGALGIQAGSFTLEVLVAEALLESRRVFIFPKEMLPGPDKLPLAARLRVEADAYLDPNNIARGAAKAYAVYMALHLALEAQGRSVSYSTGTVIHHFRVHSFYGLPVEVAR